MTEFYSPEPMDYVRVALAIETLAYHDKNFLSLKLHDNSRLSEEIQALLVEAIRPGERIKELEELLAKEKSVNAKLIAQNAKLSYNLDTAYEFICKLKGEDTYGP